ncbi:MAG: NgoFVII family restriction endonuclease [Muribaculaceae bacterium]|nr:NgoFVII family restriction endonuclease [Muribaculaceae bacterium]
MKNFYNDWENNESYFKMLSLMGRLSRLFSESDTPYIHYRVTENLFCKYFNAENLSRTDTAYDARWKDIGVGIKTFTFNSGVSTEKIAEFNSLSSELNQYNGYDLAYKLGEFRNDRMILANNLYNIKSQIYHIIGRIDNGLQIFNSPYELVDLDNIIVLGDDRASLKFSDGSHEYNFNRSKSVLMKKFYLPKKFKSIPVEILADPYSLLEELFKNKNNLVIKKETRPFVLLPLFSYKHKQKYVPEKSGLNQWNASGRLRHHDEVYIPIPRIIHKDFPNFFPSRDVIFNLHLPDGNILSAKVCQDNGKALMSNPNKALGEWILRKILKVKPGELLTINHLNKAGFDSVVIYKTDSNNYFIDVCYLDSFGNYLSQTL